MADFARGFCDDSADSSVGAVLASDADSTELSVEVILCFDVERRMDELEVLMRLGLSLTELCVLPLEPAQNRPRNREAACCIWGNEMPVGTPWDWL